MSWARFDALARFSDPLDPARLATTVHTFLNYPDVDEGRLTVIRQNSVDNRFLR